MTVCSIVLFLLIIQELETKLLNILQDLQCSSGSNSKWVGEAFSQRQGDWILVCRWVKLKLKMKNERRHIDNCVKTDFSFKLWRPSHFSIYISICTEGMSKKHFYYAILKFWILHELILYLKWVIILWSYHFHLSFFYFCCHLTEQKNYSCCIVWYCECIFYNLII